MEKSKYIKTRNSYIEEAEELINSGKTEEASTVMDKVSELDNQFDKEAKAEADLNSLKDKTRVSNLENSTVDVKANNVVAQTKLKNNFSEENPTNTLEYRNAFMKYCMTGQAIPSELKSGLKNAAAEGTTMTTDVGELIPEILIESIIEKFEDEGRILSRVTKTHYASGFKIPVSNVKLKAEWVGEGDTADLQKKAYNKISFTVHKLQCKVAVTLETQVQSLGIFEKNLIQAVAHAMITELENAIVNGSGNDCPKGIATEEIEAENKITARKFDYNLLIECEKRVKEEYANSAVWLMSRKTFFRFMGMTDTTGQPIAIVTQGMQGTEMYLLGRKVIETQHVKGKAENGGIIGIMVDLQDYVLNTSYAMHTKKYNDEDSDSEVTKCTMLCDGKMVDKDSIIQLLEGEANGRVAAKAKA